MKKEFYEKINLRHDMNGQIIVEVALGLASESGEVAQLVRKREFERISLPVGAMLMELSDVLHYLTLASSYYGLTLDELAEVNEKKMYARDIGMGSTFDALMWHYDETKGFRHEMDIVSDALKVVER